MVMAARGYATKKELKASVGKKLRVTETSIHRPEYNPNGVNTVVGPTLLKRKWYATVVVENDLIKAVY